MGEGWCSYTKVSEKVPEVYIVVGAVMVMAALNRTHWRRGPALYRSYAWD